MGTRSMIGLTTAIAAIGIAAGCGDGDESTESSSATGGSAAVSAESRSSADSGRSATGQSEDAVVTTSSLSKPEFIEKASAACIRTGKGLSDNATAYLEGHRSNNLPEDVLLANMVKAVIVPSIEAQSAAMRALGVPAGDEPELESIFAAQEEGLIKVRQLKQLKSFEVIERSFADFNQKLEDYGFFACTYG